MKTKEETQFTTALEVLSAIQSELKAPKDLYNSFGGYSYRSAESILESLKPLLAKYQSAIILSDDLELVGDRYYVVGIATLYTPHGAFSSKSRAREEESKKGMDGAQITGSASSYARKYALNGLLSIDDTKDPDATNDHGKKEPIKPVSKLKPTPTLTKTPSLTPTSTPINEVSKGLSPSKEFTTEGAKPKEVENSRRTKALNYLKKFEGAELAQVRVFAKKLGGQYADEAYKAKNAEELIEALGGNLDLTAEIIKAVEANKKAGEEAK